MRETIEPEDVPGDARDEAAVSRFVERFAADLAEAGMQRMAARVFAALLVSDAGALTSAELAEQLRITETADFFEWVQQELPKMLERWRAHQAADRAAEAREAREAEAG